LGVGGWPNASNTLKIVSPAGQKKDFKQRRKDAKKETQREQEEARGANSLDLGFASRIPGYCLDRPRGKRGLKKAGCLSLYPFDLSQR
jgi:hypothetical protein